MKNSLETRLGIFAALVVIAALIIMETLGGANVFQRGYHLAALFDTVQDLKVGDKVKMAGVDVGQVEKIALENDKVRVTMKVNSGTVVKTDSQAVIKFTGLMGQNFVSIGFGSPGRRRRLTARCSPPSSSRTLMPSCPSSMTPLPASKT